MSKYSHGGDNSAVRTRKQEGDIVITRFQKHTGEKGLSGLFEPFPKSKSADDIPASDAGMGGIPISEPDLDNRSVPPEVPDRPWLV